MRLIPFRLSAFILSLAVLCASPALAQRHESGSIGPGSLYEIDVPAQWNNDLVIYAHGIVQADEPLVAPSFQTGYAEYRAALMSAGFAVAASSFSSNGWSLDDAVRRTHQLRGLFVSKVGQPRRVYLAGHSMGALAIVKMAEQFPQQYDGALPMCGPVGGALEELQYAGDARVTFDAFFPGVLPGTAFDVPPGTSYLSPYDPGGPSPLFLSVIGALASQPGLAYAWATAAHLPFANATELGQSEAYVIGFVLRYTNDFVERVNGKIPYDNHVTQYEVNTGNPTADAALTTALNATVARYTADRAALNYYNRNYEPSGQIGVPVLTLHTLRDPAIPVEHETRFAATVANAGRSDLLSQQVTNSWGHCNFTAAEMGSAFAALVNWVETGQKP